MFEAFMISLTPVEGRCVTCNPFLLPRSNASFDMLTIASASMPRSSSVSLPPSDEI